MKLLLAAPCTLVISDPDIGHSLIGLFHDIAVKVPPEAEIPKNALLPKEWAIFSKWALSPEEKDGSYFLVAEIYWPDSTKLSQIKMSSLKSGADNAIAFIVRNQAFPFGQTGKIKILLWIEKEEDETIKVAHEPIELSISVRLDKDLVLP